MPKTGAGYWELPVCVSAFAPKSWLLILGPNAQSRCRLLGVTFLRFCLGPTILAVNSGPTCPKQVQVTGSYLSAFPPQAQILGCQLFAQVPKTGAGYWESPACISALAPKSLAVNYWPQMPKTGACYWESPACVPALAPKSLD